MPRRLNTPEWAIQNRNPCVPHVTHGFEYRDRIHTAVEYNSQFTGRDESSTLQLSMMAVTLKEPGKQRRHRRVGRQLPRWKKCLLGLVAAIGILAFFEGALAIIGVHPDAATRDPFVGFSQQSPHFVSTIGDHGEHTIETAPNRLDHFNPQRFVADKPSNTSRIVALGGSTTYGRPFFDNTSFAGWLRVILRQADPSRHYEVINAGGISYGSYRVVNVMDELSQYAPDLFIVYVGQNEFLERRTYADIVDQSPILREIGIGIRRTRIGTVLDSLISRTNTSNKNGRLLSDDVKAIPIDVVGPEAYRRDDAYRDDVVLHFHHTLERFVDTANDIGAKIVFIVPASNLRDFPPFKSENDASLSPDALDRWRRAYSEGIAASRVGDMERALGAFQEAVSIDPRHADSLFQLGKSLESRGRYVLAQERYEQALDEDVCPLRAPSSIQGIVRRVARERRVPLVDFHHLVSEQAPHGIPGYDFFVDHVHPNLRANRLLAVELARKLVADHLITPIDQWESVALPKAEVIVQNGIDPARHADELRKLSAMLDWLGQGDQAVQTAQEAVDLTPTNADMVAWIGTLQARLGRLDAAVTTLQKAVTLSPKSDDLQCRYATVLSLAGRNDDAEKHFGECLSLNAKHAAAHAGLGLLFARTNRVDDGLEQLKIATSLAPDSAEIHDNYAAVLELAGRTADAEQHYQDAVRVDARRSSAHRGLARIYELKGNWKRAIRELERVTELNPLDVDAAKKLEVLREMVGSSDAEEPASKSENP